MEPTERYRAQRIRSLCATTTRELGPGHALVGEMEHRFRRRLPGIVYTHLNSIFSITATTRERRKVFGNARVAAAAVDVLRERSAFHLVPLLAFCVMPDHVHLLMSPSRTCDVPTFVGQFKNLAQRRAWALEVRGAFWQPSFYDRGLRREDDVATLVDYILDNPVRAGLVMSRDEYAFSGCDRSGQKDGRA